MTAATVSESVETRGFQAEVSKLLHLMIHSLYSNREIFLRELVSNASDACDKLRFDSLKDASLLEGGADPVIRIDVDEKANTLIISDNGIGMSRDEVIDNLGTLARSGTAEFVSRLSGDQKKDSQLIGQFGVGFYSAFIVAKEVEVFTRRAGLASSEGVHWRSTGEGEYKIGSQDIAERGTRIVLHLRDDASDFARQWTLRELIHRYSDHVAFPIQMKKNAIGEGKTATTDEWETVNAATALWQRPRQEITEEEYQSFYHHIGHDYADALGHSHNRVEGSLEYTSLLYVPSKAPFDLYQREGVRGLKLYVQRVFIMDDAEQFLPLYLRFIKGVVDVPGLSLNVSRELLQDDGKVRKIRGALAKRVLDMLAKLAGDADKYAGFWREFGNVLKEGVAEDRDNQEKVAGLLRFYSTASADSETVSLADYIGRMPEGQKDIYYLLAENHAVAKASPHLEALKKKGYEVLLLSERIDEWMAGYLHEYQGHKLVNVGRGELDLGEGASGNKDDKSAENDGLIKRLQEALKEEVEEVRATHRLVDSPACLVLGKDDLGPQLRRLLEAQGQSIPESKPALEVNLGHGLLKSMDKLTDETRFAELAGLLLDQALLAEGQLPKDSQRLAQRLSRLLMHYAQD
jgi:molecular chaperone HtpG